MAAAYHPAVGGVETHVRELAERCVAAGDEVTVLTHQVPGPAGGAPGREWAGGVRVLRFPLTVRARRYPVSLGLFRYVREHAAEFDLIHAHNYHNLTGLAALGHGRPFVFTPHYHGTGHTWLASVLHHLYRPAGARLFRAAGAVICVSAAERDLVAGRFPAAAGKTVVIPNGIGAVPPGPPKPAARQAGEVPGPVVVTVGRLERYKNVDLVIRAFQDLPDPATLLIVGDGPDRARLERYSRAGPARWPVRFTSRVPGQVLGQLLAQASVIVSASDHEAFGLTVAEGLASGARVVASAIPAHESLAAMAGPGSSVILADPRDTRQFSGSIAAALAAGRVPAGTVRLPSWAEVTTATRELYADLQARAVLGAGTAPRSRPAPAFPGPD